MNLIKFLFSKKPNREPDFTVKWYQNYTLSFWWKENLMRSDFDNDWYEIDMKNYRRRRLSPIPIGGNWWSMVCGLDMFSKELFNEVERAYTVWEVEKLLRR